MTKNHNNPAIKSITPSPEVLICDHFNQWKEYKVSRPEGTKDWLITYTISGNGQFTIDDHVQFVKKGDIAILKPKNGPSIRNTWFFMGIRLGSLFA